MRFARQMPVRRRREAVVPMINVVFLLLIFFLMSAAIAPRDPVAVTLPGASVAPEEAGTREALFVTADGVVALGDLRGDAALSAAVARREGGPLDLRVDGALSATRLATVLARLSAAGIGETRLITRRD